VVSTRYTTVNVIRTIEDLLGIDYIGMTDANAKPMAENFTRQADLTPYTAILPGNLCQAPVDVEALGLTEACQNPDVPKSVAVRSRHDASWWANATRNFNFDGVDHLEADAFNRVLWTGLKGEDIPYPTERSGLDLSRDRNS
jgi:DNA-binding beta-propeller fold protein YncE